MKRYMIASILLISAAHALPDRAATFDTDAVPNSVPAFNDKNAMLITTFDSKGCDKPMKQKEEHAIADGHGMTNEYALNPRHSLQISNMKDCSIQLQRDKNLGTQVQATTTTYTEKDQVKGVLCLTRQQLQGFGSYVVSCPEHRAQGNGAQGGSGGQRGSSTGQGAGNGGGGNRGGEEVPGTGGAAGSAAEELGGRPRGGRGRGQILP